MARALSRSTFRQLSPEPGARWANLGAGAMKVLKADDGYVAFQNGIYWDAERGRSGSAILLLGSDDGTTWRSLADEPLLTPSGDGWMRSHVYALDVRRTGEGRFHLYFNARDGWHWTSGRERIGLLLGAAARP